MERAGIIYTINRMNVSGAADSAKLCGVGLLLQCVAMQCMRIRRVIQFGVVIAAVNVHRVCSDEEVIACDSADLVGSFFCTKCGDDMTFIHRLTHIGIPSIKRFLYYMYN